MKPFYFLLLALGPLAAHGQIVQSMGAGNIVINWRPLAATDSLVLDIDGNVQPDVVFTSTNVTSGSQGQASSRTFKASVRAGSGVEIAIDDNEFDSVHRFVAGDLIGPGLRWQNTGGGFLDYAITGNGGTGGRGFFRFHASGFIAFRKNTGGQMRYWWFYIEPRLAATDTWVSYYAGTSVALATRGGLTPAFTVFAYPNPTTSVWRLSSTVKYRLFDVRGRLVHKELHKPTDVVEAENLPPGIYSLLMYDANGAVGRQVVVKE
jgi:hypothetical protein